MAAEERPWLSAKPVRISAVLATVLGAPAAWLTVAGPHNDAPLTRALPTPAVLLLAAVTAVWPLGRPDRPGPLPRRPPPDRCR